MAALCAASFFVVISCQSDKNDRDDDGDLPVKVDPDLVGIWELFYGGGSGQYIQKIRINEDGTGEVLYYDLDNLEFQYDYSVKFVFGEYNTLTFTIDGVTPKTEVKLRYNNQSETLDLYIGNFSFCYEKADEWGDYGITNIFVGSWESDDSYDKIYLNVEEYEFLERGSHGVYVDKDNNEYPCMVNQIHDAMKYYILSLFKPIEGPEPGEEMAVPLNMMYDWNYYSYFTDPVRDGDKLKVNMEGIQRTLKPMKEWPFSNFDDIYTPPEPGEKG